METGERGAAQYEGAALFWRVGLMGWRWGKLKNRERTKLLSYINTKIKPLRITFFYRFCQGLPVVPLKQEQSWVGRQKHPWCLQWTAYDSETQAWKASWTQSFPVKNNRLNQTSHKRKHKVIPTPAPKIPVNFQVNNKSFSIAQTQKAISSPFWAWIHRIKNPPQPGFLCCHSHLHVSTLHSARDRVLYSLNWDCDPKAAATKNK